MKGGSYNACVNLTQGFGIRLVVPLLIAWFHCGSCWLVVKRGNACIRRFELWTNCNDSSLCPFSVRIVGCNEFHGCLNAVVVFNVSKIWMMTFTMAGADGIDCLCRVRRAKEVCGGRHLTNAIGVLLSFCDQGKVGWPVFGSKRKHEAFSFVFREWGLVCWSLCFANRVWGSGLSLFCFLSLFGRITLWLLFCDFWFWRWLQISFFLRLSGQVACLVQEICEGNYVSESFWNFL